MRLFWIDWLIFIFILFKGSPLAMAQHESVWIVWNVGQGQWVTHVLNDECHHYDVGGEVGSLQRIRLKILLICGKKMNGISLSHWDFDHYSNIPGLVRLVPHVCWLNVPQMKTAKKSALEVENLKVIPCIFRPIFEAWYPDQFLTTNDSSSVFRDGSYLIPGDSPLNKEKIWVRKMKKLRLVNTLILGHHGSRTSTGVELLSHLTNLKLAIASARYPKYHHPHIETLFRLKKFKVPVLKTEDWGNLILAD